MTKGRINDLNADQKGLTDLRDELNQHLRQALSLADVAMLEGFLKCDENVVDDYLWTLQTHISLALETNRLINKKLSEGCEGRI